MPTPVTNGDPGHGICVHMNMNKAQFETTRILVDIAHFETTTTHTALYIHFLQKSVSVFRPLFGACHFCTFDISDLADFTLKFPQKQIFLGRK